MLSSLKKSNLDTMKNKNRNLGTKVLLLFMSLVLVGSMTATAQITLPGGGDANIPDAPIDGLLSIGLIAGACIGLRKHIQGLKD